MTIAAFLPWLSLAAALLGFIFLFFGIRGRPIPHEPRCRHCGLGLLGLVPDTEASDWKSSGDWRAKVCPECGSSLVRPRSVRRTTRRKRWGILTASFLLLFAAAGLITPTVAARVRAFNPAASAPTRAMALLLPTASGADVKDMLDTIDGRRVSGDISSGDIRALAKAALQRQQDRTKAWDPRLGDLIEEAFDRDLISVKDALAYIGAAIRVDVTVLDQVVGGSLDVSLQCRIDPSIADYQRRSGRLRTIPIAVELEPVLLDKQEAQETADFSNRTVTSFNPGMGWSDMRRIAVPAVDRDAVIETAYTVRIDETLWESDAMKDQSRSQIASNGGGVYYANDQELPAFHPADNALMWRQTVSIPVTLTANTRLPIEEVHDASLAASATKAFAATIEQRGASPYSDCSITLDCDRAVLPIAVFGTLGVKWNGGEPAPTERTVFSTPQQPQPRSPPNPSAGRTQFYVRVPANWDRKAPELVLIPDRSTPEYAMGALREAQRRGQDLRILADPIVISTTLVPQSQPGNRPQRPR